MSASGKLKRLLGARTLRERVARISALNDALPQLVALTEAAEKGVRWESVTTSISVEDARVLYAALIDLGEVLP